MISHMVSNTDKVEAHQHISLKDDAWLRRPVTHLLPSEVRPERSCEKWMDYFSFFFLTSFKQAGGHDQVHPL